MNSNIFIFENIRDMVLKNVQLESAKRHQFIWNKQKDVETRFIDKTTKSTEFKKDSFRNNIFFITHNNKDYSILFLLFITKR